MWNSKTGHTCWYTVLLRVTWEPTGVLPTLCSGCTIPTSIEFGPCGKIIGTTILWMSPTIPSLGTLTRIGVWTNHWHIGRPNVFRPGISGCSIVTRSRRFPPYETSWATTLRWCRCDTKIRIWIHSCRITNQIRVCFKRPATRSPSSAIATHGSGIVIGIEI